MVIFSWLDEMAASWICLQMKARTSTCSAIQLKKLAQRQKIIRMLFFILIGFFICYLPFTISIIVRNKIVLGNTINSVSLTIHTLFLLGENWLTTFNKNKKRSLIGCAPCCTHRVMSCVSTQPSILSFMDSAMIISKKQRPNNSRHWNGASLLLQLQFPLQQTSGETCLIRKKFTFNL